MPARGNDCRMRPSMFALAALVIFGCSPTGTTGPVDHDHEIVPLRVGSQWTWFVADSGASPFFRDTTVKAIIVKDTVVGGNRWFFADHADLVATSSMSWMRNDATGLYQSMPPFPFGYLTFQYPAHVGTTYLGAAMQLRVTSADALVTVPAGTFHCVVYVEPDPRPTAPANMGIRWLYVAPGVGIVKDVTARSYDSQGNLVGTRVRVLVNFTP